MSRNVTIRSGNILIFLILFYSLSLQRCCEAQCYEKGKNGTVRTRSRNAILFRATFQKDVVKE